MKIGGEKMQKRIAVLSATVLDTALKVRDGSYYITRAEEVGIVRGTKYFEFWVLKYDLINRQIFTKAKEIELILPESIISKVDNISLVQAGMLVFNEGGILKVSNGP